MIIEENSTKNNVEFYDHLWKEEWQDMERLNPTARHLERMIVKLIHQTEGVRSLVDVGCGMGVNVKRIRKHFPDLFITGTDLSPNILRIAENYVGADPKTKYRPFDLGKDRLEEEFDLVLCSQVLEHIEDDRMAIQNLARMCKRYLLITVPAGKFNSTSTLNGHFRHYQLNDLTKKVVEANFEILYVRQWGFPFHSIYKSLLDFLPIESQKKVGLGKYGPLKKLITHILFTLFYANVFDRGDNIILLAQKKK